MWRKLRHGRIWRRILLERLTAPIHLNLLSAGVALAGGFRAKVAFDLVLRHHHAYALLQQADEARRLGHDRLTAVECGVAAGAGRMNMIAVAKRVTAITGVRFDIYGFDTGEGMPPPRDHRDHPEHYSAGDFKMDVPRLERALGSDARLVLGDLAETVPPFAANLTADAPLAFVSLDVDYYSSAKSALGLLEGPERGYLPTTLLYADDVSLMSHNHSGGELLAIDEFNAGHDLRRLERPEFLAGTRVFQHAPWLKQMYVLHVLDHPARQPAHRAAPARALENPYLR
jgi:hypothetical protein